MLIDGVVKNYAWGSRTAIPEMFGWPRTGEPVAEVWFGAHRMGSSQIRGGGTRLDQRIRADPLATLGKQAAERFASLPFLLKVISAAEPLSLQAHPSIEQAQAGFAREDSQKIDRQAPNRSFRDRNHKPELLCALSEFSALCGLREPAVTLEFLETIPTAALNPLRHKLIADSSPSGLAHILGWLLRQDGSTIAAQISALVAACAKESSLPFAPERRVALQLGRCYAQDPAVLIALLLNYVTLQPREAIFLGAGNLHAYLYGSAVEVMANSDNVLRAGLTNKHVDTNTLLNIVDSAPLAVDVQRPTAVGGFVRYRSPVAEFSLQRIDVEGEIHIAGGPAILLCIAGEADLQSPHGPHRLRAADGAWLDAASGVAWLSGNATIFRAGLGEDLARSA